MNTPGLSDDGQGWRPWGSSPPMSREAGSVCHGIYKPLKYIWNESMSYLADIFTLGETLFGQHLQQRN